MSQCLEKGLLMLLLVHFALASQHTSYLLAESMTCEDISGCKSASTAATCKQWVSELEQKPDINVSASINPAPACYLYGKDETAYFNDFSTHTIENCNVARKCVCQCTGKSINVALYHDIGASTRGKNNIFTVLSYPGSGIRVVNFTGADVALHLNTSAIDVVVFPGGGGTTEASGLGPAGLAAVKAFVAAGGGYVGICAGAYLAIQHLKISAFKDMPRPDGAQKGEHNTTISSTIQDRWNSTAESGVCR